MRLHLSLLLDLRLHLNNFVILFVNLCKRLSVFFDSLALEGKIYRMCYDGVCRLSVYSACKVLFLRKR